MSCLPKAICSHPAWCLRPLDLLPLQLLLSTSHIVDARQHHRANCCTYQVLGSDCPEAFHWEQEHMIDNLQNAVFQRG